MSQVVREIFMLDRSASREIDRRAMDEYGIPGVVLMENASRAIADHAMQMMNDSPARVSIVCGVGNNGGDGYAAARHLQNAGCDVQVVSIGQPRSGSDAAVNAMICQKMDIAIHPAASLVRTTGSADLVIDAIFGTGLDREVTDEPADIIALLNELGRPVLAVDVPSGMDCESGRELSEAVRAKHTVTFAGLKPGFVAENAPQLTGTISIADIGVPRELVVQLGKAIDPATLATCQTRPGSVFTIDVC